MVIDSNLLLTNCIATIIVCCVTHLYVRKNRQQGKEAIGKEFFISPGGSIEAGETAKQALVRELKEEFTIDVTEENLEKFGDFEAAAAGQEDRIVHMAVFIVKQFSGEPSPDNEVEEIAWITSANEHNLKIGSIFEHEVIPALKQQNLID